MMKHTLRKLCALLLSMALCLSAGLSAMAANENNTQEVTFSAALSASQIEVSEEAQSVTLTIRADKPVTMDGCGFTAVWDEALKLSAVSENLDNFSYPADSVDLETGIVGGCSDDMENVTGVTELAVLTFIVPAGTPAGTYEVGAKDLELTMNYGEVIWESAASVSAALTITAPSAPENPELIDFAGTTMTLGNNLSINFVVDTAKLSGTGHYAVITKEYEDKDDLTITIPRSEWKVYSGTNYYFSFDKVAAKEMTDRLIVNVYDADGNKVVNEKIDSVRDYAMRALTKEEAKTAPDAEKLALYVDMLNYGAAAQTYFDNYHASDLANSQLTDTQKAYATASVTMEDIREKGTAYVGTTLTLESEIILNFVYNTSEINNISYAVAAYTDHYGNEKSVTIQSSEFKEYDATRTYIPVSGMAVADCSQPVTLKLYTAGDGSMGVDSATTVDSVESYVARIANADALYTTIMKFASSAYASFH